MIVIAPFHIPRPNENVSDSEWTSFLEAWSFVIHSYLALSSEKFEEALNDSDSLPTFLSSYLDELGLEGKRSPKYHLDKRLHRDCYSVIHRAWFSTKTPEPLLSASFIKNFCIAYRDVPESAAAIDRLWSEKRLGESQSIQNDKESLQQRLEPGTKRNAEQLGQSLLGARAFVKLCHQYGNFLMVGADLLDALLQAWHSEDAGTKRKIIFLMYAMLLSLAHDKEKHLSTLADHLYTLRMDHEKSQPNPSPLTNLITMTPFLYKYRHIAEEASSKRLTDMLPNFEKLGTPPRPKQSVSKGKQAMQPVSDDPELETSAAISTVHDLFPTLGLGYIARLLDEYAHNPEEVTAHLLENSLPAHLQTLGQDESLEAYHAQQKSHREANGLSDPQRRNIFDFDELDHLQVATGKLHMGKKLENPLLEPANKSAILSALAALDSDDDERDDTYDAEDVGGTIDVENPEHDRRDAADAHDTMGLSEKTEAALFQKWTSDLELFSRKPVVRNSRARAELRELSGWADEQIEGWASMLQREPKRLKRLRDKYPPEYYARESKTQADDDDGSDQNSEDPARGENSTVPGRGRGPRRRGGGRGGRGRGDVAGSASEQSTQKARQHKDANKASRANHNRRAQRAKKMARGGF